MPRIRDGQFLHSIVQLQAHLSPREADGVECWRKSSRVIPNCHRLFALVMYRFNCSTRPDSMLRLRSNWHQAMKITVVYDNCLARKGLITGWGFSCLIETKDTPQLLFDTGADGATLLHNMRKLGIAPSQIGIIVISHAHGDHTGGLSDILEVNRHAEIYVPASSTAEITGRKATLVSKPLQISKDIFSTGELKGMEQSLVLKTGKGIVVVVGCSHPGVGTILDAASLHGEVYGIVGGLHGFRDFDRLRGLSLICPCHCTQHKSELKRLFPEQYISCGAGREFEL